MDIVFLDIDGVLNNYNSTHNDSTHNKSPQGFIGVEDKYLHRLNTIIVCTGAEIVLVSDWKDCWDKDVEHCNPDGEYLNRRFKEHEIKITDKTDDKSRGNDWSSGRGYGIKNILKRMKEYVILDDVLFSDYEKEIRKHLVLTDNGITDDDVEVAVNILMGKLLDDNYSLMRKDL